MAKVSTSISIDADVKAQAQALFADFGLDLSTAINIFLRQSIRENCIPFSIQREVPNADTIAAMREADDMVNHPEQYGRPEEGFGGMKYDVRMSARFKKDMKLVQKRGYDQRLIFEVIELLANGMKLDEKYKDHLLTGDYGGFRECHITPDWLLVYQYREQELLLLLSRTGTHSDLF